MTLRFLLAVGVAATWLPAAAAAPNNSQPPAPTGEPATASPWNPPETRPRFQLAVHGGWVPVNVPLVSDGWIVGATFVNRRFPHFAGIVRYEQATFGWTAVRWDGAIDKGKGTAAAGLVGMRGYLFSEGRFDPYLGGGYGLGSRGALAEVQAGLDLWLTRWLYVGPMTTVQWAWTFGGPPESPHTYREDPYLPRRLYTLQLTLGTGFHLW